LLCSAKRKVIFEEGVYYIPHADRAVSNRP
jgi:hypothetical protein